MITITSLLLVDLNGINFIIDVSSYLQSMVVSDVLLSLISQEKYLLQSYYRTVYLIEC